MKKLVNYPKNVEAFFQRKINATQGSREERMTFTKGEGNSWVASYTFTAPGDYILRSVYLDGVEYVLKDVPAVHIEGFTIVSLNCDQVTEGRHVDVLTADKTTTLGLKLKFASSDLSKMPSSVQGRFTRDEDGVAVNINFTYNSTTGLWTGTGTFLNSGKYTMQYLTLNGEYTGLEESLWITADIKLGMKAAVYTTDITNFKFAPDEMIENGTDQLQMQVKIMDNGDKVLSGLENVKLTYRLKNSASTIDVDLDWNAASRYYEGDMQALDAGPGEWVFYRISVGDDTITMATTYPTFRMQAPEPPSFVGIGPSAMQYKPNGDAAMQVNLKYSGTATVAAVFKDSTGKRYPVMGTVGTTADNVTTWNFAVPTINGKQDGNWTLETVYLWNYYKADGTYVEWEKELQGDKEVVKGDLMLNADGSLVPNEYRNDEGAIVIDVKSNNSGSDYTVKVIQTVKVDFTSGQQSQNFGKNGDNVTGEFMDQHMISNLQVKITDFEGKAIGSDLVMTITYKNNTSEKYGGYTNSDLENASIVYETKLIPDNTGTVFTQETPITLFYAGEYTTTFTFKLNGNSAQLTNAGVQKIGDIPQFTVSSVKPTLTIGATSPVHGETYNTLGTDGKEKSVSTTVNGRTITIYPEVTLGTSGCDTTVTINRQAKVTLQLAGMGNATKAILIFNREGDTVYLYPTNANGEKVSSITNSFEWTTGQSSVTRIIGNYDYAKGCNAIENIKNAGTIESQDSITLECVINGATISVTVKVDPITIIQQ